MFNITLYNSYILRFHKITQSPGSRPERFAVYRCVWIHFIKSKPIIFYSSPGILERTYTNDGMALDVERYGKILLGLQPTYAKNCAPGKDLLI